MDISNINGTSGSVYQNSPSENKTGKTGGFADAIAEAQKEAEKASADDEIIEFSEKGTGKITVNGSYEVTEKQAEYFRGKYGSHYDEDKAVELYYQLADNGVISENDACTLTGFGGIIWLGDLPIEESDLYKNGQLTRFINIPIKAERHLVKSVVYTDPNSPFYGLWQKFEDEYGKVSKTWADDIEKRIAFEHWQYENGCFDTDFSLRSYEKRLEGLEKTLGVINSIFG